MTRRIVLRRFPVTICILLSIGPALWAQNGPVSPPMPGVASTIKADLSVPGEVRGLRCISDKAFPAPAGTEEIAVPGGDFEADGKMPAGWEGQKGRVVAAADAPNGKAYFEMEAVNGPTMRTRRVSRISFPFGSRARRSIGPQSLSPPTSGCELLRLISHSSLEPVNNGSGWVSIFGCQFHPKRSNSISCLGMNRGSPGISFVSMASSYGRLPKLRWRAPMRLSDPTCRRMM